MYRTNDPMKIAIAVRFFKSHCFSMYGGVRCLRLLFTFRLNISCPLRNKLFQCRKKKCTLPSSYGYGY